MKQFNLFIMDIDKDEFWNKYLSSFPKGTNKMFRERTEYDCQSCKHFIKYVGNLITIIENKIVTIWDIDIDDVIYNEVAEKLSKFVKKSLIKNVFFHFENNVGVDKNFQKLENEEILTWEHFYIKLPNKFVVKNNEDRNAKLSDIRSTKEVFYRSLSEITLDSIETVLELIDQNSLYRGQENRYAVSEFLKHKELFDSLKTKKKKDIYCWNLIANDLTQSISKIRNTAIGTLLTDLSEGKDLEKSVKSFESKVAPTNYQRPTALITKAMIDKAEKKISDLGYLDSLERRHAVTEDITINNVLFANRETKKIMNVFDELKLKTKSDTKNLDKVESLDIETFINNILPKATSIELLFENRHSANLFSLIAPQHKDSKIMFKWHNNFSWSYIGNLADSIKERVKNAGGNVEGDLRCSLSWFNTDDLDLHMIEPNRHEIYYGDKKSSYTGGHLDVDMNVTRLVRNAVENICYPDRNRMIEGTYKLFVNNYNRRESIDVGFDVEIEFDNIIYSFSYPNVVKNNANVEVAKFKFTRKGGIEFISSLQQSQSSKEIWGINSQNFHNVKMIMYSPNYWDNKSIGNRHYFFVLDNCLNDTKPRGFFNEYLKDELRDHRKVFEVLGSKMLVEKSNNQLSGLGFSSTKRNHVFCKVSGNFQRTIKLTF